MGLLGSAAARPETTVFGTDAYLWTKAAALLQSIVKSHALVDGNERLGWLATAVLRRDHLAPVVHASNEGVYDLVLGVAAGGDSVDSIAVALRRPVTNHSTEASQ